MQTVSIREQTRFHSLYSPREYTNDLRLCNLPLSRDYTPTAHYSLLRAECWHYPEVSVIKSVTYMKSEVEIGFNTPTMVTEES